MVIITKNLVKPVLQKEGYKSNDIEQRHTSGVHKDHKDGVERLRVSELQGELRP
jgi:hypothetical protein